MKIKTPFFVIEIEWLFFIVFLVSLMSKKVLKILSSFYVCYLFIVFHELSHIFVAAIFGKDIEKFKFTLSGVCIEFKRNYEDSMKIKKSIILKNIIIYLAGPVSNLILAFLFKKNEMIFQINIFFALINVIPIYPLDGYNILNNIFDFFRLNRKLKEIILNFSSYFFMSFICIIGIFQFFISKNPAVIIFSLYLFLLKKQSEKKLKIDKINYNFTC